MGHRDGDLQINAEICFANVPAAVWELELGLPGAEEMAEWVAIETLPPLETLAFDHGDTIRLYLESLGKLRQNPILV